MKLTIDPEDELTHDPDRDPVWRESYWVDVVDEETGTGLLMYCGVRPGIGLGNGFLNVATRDRVLYSFRDYDIEVRSHEGGHTDLDIGPFSVLNGEPLETQTFKFDNGACQVDLEFESEVSVYDYPWPWTRSRHYEQLGRAKAIVRVGDEAPLVLTGSSARDHAWGLRQLLSWNGFVWITCRAVEGGPSWTMSWLNTEDRSQTLGHLIDVNGDAFIATEVEVDVDYADGVPTTARLRMEFEGYWRPVEVELALYGPIDLSGADPDKQGGYFFAFAEGTTNGLPCTGTFDIHWRSGLSPLRRLPF